MVNFMLNGELVSAESDTDTPLLWVLREELKLRGTKFGCGIAQCGGQLADAASVAGKPCRPCLLAASLPTTCHSWHGKHDSSESE